MNKIDFSESEIIKIYQALSVNIEDNKNFDIEHDYGNGENKEILLENITLSDIQRKIRKAYPTLFK